MSQRLSQEDYLATVAVVFKKVSTRNGHIQAIKEEIALR